MSGTSNERPPVMLGMELPDVDHWSPRVTVALGQNPGPFSGPGTNTYIVGTGEKRILLDPGQGVDAYLPVLERAMEAAGCSGFEQIVLTHGHPDHMGGVGHVCGRFGDLPVSKFPWPGVDDSCPRPLRLLEDGARVETEGATLRAVHTPGHAPDHLCFVLEEEGALFSGDNILGVGTTVIPAETGDLADYMASLARLEAEAPTRIYPAHGPCIEEGLAKVREYIAHRNERELQILAALTQLGGGPATAPEIVKIVYAAYPEALHAAAAASVTSHLKKLQRHGSVRGEPGGSWERVAS